MVVPIETGVVVSTAIVWGPVVRRRWVAVAGGPAVVLGVAPAMILPLRGVKAVQQVSEQSSERQRKSSRVSIQHSCS